MGRSLIAALKRRATQKQMRQETLGHPAFVTTTGPEGPILSFGTRP